ncbi:MAG TPA: hypothetical protein VGS96_00365 [Thermoanaerobaculia bacterium]|jgi:hypothetical protein|nr:hypothetical protein [Thermoanaerobaculia bacterium]
MRVLSERDHLQDALEDAKPGDVIALAPGAVFKGPIKLPNKPGSEWITIRTNAAEDAFPKRGTRVDPSYARLMPIIESDTDSAITADPGAHHYRFIGIEFRPKPGTYLGNVITLGTDERSLEAMPHHIVFERCYVHGDPKAGARRGIALNSLHTAVIDSYVADFKEEGADSQALAGWNGLGPFAIVNNYLEAAGENVIFGGADPAVGNLVPSDITIQRNQFTKPLSWKVGDPSYAGTEWSVKNLFELKNARRVLVEDNVFENNWPQGQNGFAILFTPRNQDGASPWSMVRDVTFVGNIVRNTSSAVNMLGTDDINVSQQTKRIVIRDNLFEDVGGEKWGGGGRLFQILGATVDVVIEHNTALQTGDVIVGDGQPSIGFIYRNNLTPHNEYGVGGTSTFGNPSRTLATFFPGAVFAGNVLIGGAADEYPPGNFFPSTAQDVGFVDFAGGDYRLATTSPYKAAGTDGKDIGADIGPHPPARTRLVRKH